MLVGACAVVSTDAPHGTEASRPSPVGFHTAFNGLPVRGIWKSTPAVADVNADGYPDLIALPRQGLGPQVWLGKPDVTWVEASAGLELPGSCGGGVVATDVNRDGHPDLVIGDHCSGVFVFLGDGRGGWRRVVENLNPAIARTIPATDDAEDQFTGAEDVAVGDVNEDGFADLVVAASNVGGFTVYLGDGSGKSWSEITTPDGLPSGVDAEPDDREQAGWANRVLLADIDGDNHLDVVASYHSGPRVWRGNGAARWTPFSRGLPSPQAGGIYRALGLGDVDGDGRVDLVTTNLLEGVEVYGQTADGEWRRLSSPALSSVAGGASAVALGDLDGDGHLDLVVGGRRTRDERFGLFVFLGNGRAEWREVATRLPPERYPFIWGITLGDMNRDGALDVVVATGVVVQPPRTRRAGDGELRGARESLRPGDPHLQVWINASSAR